MKLENEIASITDKLTSILLYNKIQVCKICTDAAGTIEKLENVKTVSKELLVAFPEKVEGDGNFNIPACLVENLRKAMNETYNPYRTIKGEYEK